MYGNADGWGAILNTYLGGKRRYTHTTVGREIVKGGQAYHQKTIFIELTLSRDQAQQP